MVTLWKKDGPYLVSNDTPLVIKHSKFDRLLHDAWHSKYFVRYEVWVKVAFFLNGNMTVKQSHFWWKLQVQKSPWKSFKLYQNFKCAMKKHLMFDTNIGYFVFSNVTKNVLLKTLVNLLHCTCTKCNLWIAFDSWKFLCPRLFTAQLRNKTGKYKHRLTHQEQDPIQHMGRTCH